MLQRLRIKNFKLLRDVELTFSHLPTVLIGTNASGKSTVIEVIDFLARCGADGFQEALRAHGGIHAVRTIGSTEPIEVESTWAFLNGEREWNLTWRIAFVEGQSGVANVETESLTDGERILLSTGADGTRSAVDETDAVTKASLIKDRKKLAFEALVDAVRFPGLDYLGSVLRETRVLGALSSVPAWARASTDRASPRDSLVISTESYVGREGLGLANALYNLQIEHSDAWSRLERAFRAEFPFVKRIVFPPDPGGSRISFAIEDERFPSRKTYASELSDGMIVFLCLLTLIVHPDQEAVLALDEPDAHLHPSAVRRLLTIASEPHKRRHLVIVTHSNAILDELADPARSIRIVESTPTGARIRQLEPAALAAWRNDYALSDLRRTGLLDPSNSSYGTSE